MSGSSNSTAATSGAHQATAQRDLLLLVGRQASRTHVELVAHLQHLGNLAHALLDLRLGHLAVLEREGQVRPPSWCRRSPGTETPGHVANRGVANASSNSTLPCEGTSRPDMMLSMVVLPQPEGAEQRVGATVFKLS